MEASYGHSVYGLTVHSEIELPCPSSTGSADITVQFTNTYCVPERSQDGTYSFLVGPNSAFFHYRDVALYEIINGRRLLINSASSADFRLVLNTLVGTPMGIVLLQRGFLVLHASAVEVEGKVVCIVGSSCMGKSTTALSLLMNGHKLVSDDVIALDTMTSDGIKVKSGYPWMKVGSKAVSAFNIPSDNLIELDRTAQKKKLLLSERRFANNPERLSSLIFLDWGHSLRMDQLSAQQALIHLVPHSYGFVPRTDYPGEEKKRFFQCKNIIESVPCFLLERPVNANTMKSVAEMIEEKVAAL